MSTYLLAANPIHGHVGPILQVARHLVGLGHDVTVLTGARFQGRVVAGGAAFRALTGRADYDDREPDTYLPDRARYSGVARAQYDIRTIFVETIPDQFRSLRAAIDDIRPDAVLVDGAFGGALPMLASPSERPPILALGVTPLSQSSRSLAPYGMGLPPARSALGRLRYAALGAVARKVIFRPTQQAGRRAFAECGETLTGFVMDASREFDGFLQTGVAEMEYPRDDLAANTVFVGVLPQDRSQTDVPDWWDDLEPGPVVHVTQGTIDNRDFDRLVRPTLDALAHDALTVVVSAGGRGVETVGDLPANARAETYLSYDLLLPRLDVFVTNGGFGGVQAALAAGVPIVIAGDTEDKPEVAARVAWTGAGVDLGTGTPTPTAIRDAVRTILADPSYRRSAERIAHRADQHDALAEIARRLSETPVRGSAR